MCSYCEKNYSIARKLADVTLSAAKGLRRKAAGFFGRGVYTELVEVLPQNDIVFLLLCALHFK